MEEIEKILNGYQALLRWSEEDESYLVEFPALGRVLAHGDTLKEAEREGLIAIRVHMQVAQETGIPVPPPLPSIEDIVHVAPLINAAELARRAHIHPRTFAAKLQRKTPLTPKEAKAVEQALKESGLKLVS